MISAFLVLTGAVLFGLPQPNVLVLQGIPVLAYIAYVPVFLVTRRLPWKLVPAAGLCYGVASYCFLTYWLASFHPLGIFVISVMYGLYLALVFPLLKVCVVLFPRRGWLLQWAVWVAWEYVKTLGFTGFHYGVTAYSHWQFPLLTQIADVTGVWGLSALIVFPSAWFSAVLSEGVPGSHPAPTLSGNRFLPAAGSHGVSLAVWGICFAAVLVYGLLSLRSYDDAATVQVALVQNNTDPWKTSEPGIDDVASYRADLAALQRLSDRALAEHPEVDFVVWPETAFVPRIQWHYRHRYDQRKFALVEDLLQYLDAAPVPFVLGNDHGVDGYLRDGTRGTVDYNAVLLFEPGKNVLPPTPAIYRKMHLVPFTEYFPFEERFPRLYEALLNGDTHLWEPGTESTVFTLGKLVFSTPVCFEDTFGDSGRRFVRAGARAFVNLSNDAWSKSLACQYQHLSMAVFRSVENRVPTVRSTASGQTASVDPNGRVTAMAPPFTEAYLVADVPLVQEGKMTIYTRFGDWFGILAVTAALGGLLYGIGRKLWQRRKT